MSEWGELWGELWGDAVAEIENHAEQAIDRLVYALSCSVEFKKLIKIYADRQQAFEHVARGVTPTLLFDIPTAYGKQLDQLGTILLLPREGWSDELYRVYLRTQALLILPDRRTQKKLLQVARSLFDSDAGTIVYAEYRPKTYTLSVGGVDLNTFQTWVRFLERCRPATYNATIIWTSDEPFGFSDESGVVVDTVYPFSDASNTIDVGGTWSAVVPIIGP